MPDNSQPGDTHRRGYGAAHQRLRRRWAPIVATGNVTCPRCQQPIARGERWDLGHEPGTDKRAYRGPEHARCNRATTGRERTATDPTPRPRTHW